MNRPRRNSRWDHDGIMPWESDESQGSHTQTPSAVSNDDQVEVILVDSRGRPVLLVAPRPLGFDPRRVTR